MRGQNIWDVMCEGQKCFGMWDLSNYSHVLQPPVLYDMAIVTARDIKFKNLLFVTVFKVYYDYSALKWNILSLVAVCFAVYLQIQISQSWEDGTK